MTGFELAKLRKKGLEDPYQALIDDLTGEPVISLEEVTGLSHPNFNYRDRVCILSDHRAVGEFQDDLSLGRALLSYDVTDEGWITWKVIQYEMY